MHVPSVGKRRLMCKRKWKDKILQLQLILIRDTKPTKCTDLFIISVYRSVALSISKCFDPQGTISREPNKSNNI